MLIAEIYVESYDWIYQNYRMIYVKLNDTCYRRDIKAGNILLNAEGHAKLADFGVAGQLTVSAIICVHHTCSGKYL